MTPKPSARPALLVPASPPALFATARGTSERALVAVVAGLLTAFALHAGAFLPRFAERGPADAGAAAAERGPAPAVAARGGAETLPAAAKL